MKDLEDLEIYQESMRIGEVVWSLVEEWSFFEKKTVGDQVVRSADSVAANLAEGYGRYHFADNRRFCYYSRGSLRETLTWLKKAANRSLIPENTFKELEDSIMTLRKRLDAYIKSIGRNQNTPNEARS